MCKFIDSARECFPSKKSEHNNRLINDSTQTQVTLLSPCLETDAKIVRTINNMYCLLSQSHNVCFNIQYF